MNVPEGWTETKIGEIAQINPPLPRKVSPAETVTFLGMADIGIGEILTPQKWEAKEVSSGFTQFADGDILLGKITPCFENGKGCLCDGLQNGVGFGSTEFIVIRASDKAAAGFLFSHVLSTKFRSKGTANMVGSAGQKRLQPSFVRAYSIPLPPLAEQIAIARILSLWDNAIRDTTQLIAAKTRFKRALMQQLLTGRRRFAEFAGEEWKSYRLGELFSERAETNRPDLPLLSITANRGVIARGEVERKDTSNVDKKAYLRIARGDIGYNTMRMWQGVSAVSQLEGIVSPAYTICVPDERIEADYAGYVFKSAAMVSLFHRHSQGMVNDTLSLKFHHFARLTVCIPAREEQRKITAVFQQLDSEVQLLHAQLAALKAQKRGLMQKLLTGEIRVLLTPGPSPNVGRGERQVI